MIYDNMSFNKLKNVRKLHLPIHVISSYNFSWTLTNYFRVLTLKLCRLLYINNQTLLLKDCLLFVKAVD